MLRSRALLFAAAVSLAAVPLFAASRLTYTSNGVTIPVAWASFPVRYEVDRRVATSLPGGVATVERAFDVWTTIPNADVSFTDGGVSDGLRAGFDGRNSVTLADGLFANQNAVALTTYWDDGSGRRKEADIQLDASLLNSNYNVPQALTHEVGHLLGLDHSGVISAMMYPYVSRGSDTPALDSDDRIAIATMYPRRDLTLVGGTIQGRVVGDDGGVFAAQVVAVNAEGEPVATALSDSSGSFTIQGLPADSYRIYAEPLDGPVDPRNLSGPWQKASLTSFPTQFVDGGVLRIEEGKVYGNLIVNTSGPAPQLNPRWIGLAAPSSDTFSLTSTAQGLRPGQSTAIAVAGDGITGGMTTFEVLNPGVKRTSDFRYAGNYVSANFTVTSDAPGGSAVILVNSGNQSATLTGALRIQAPPLRGRSVRR